MIDTTEGRDVATADIPGDFLQTDYDKKDTPIKMDGKTVTILEGIDPSYYKDVIYINIRGKMYVCIIKEFYIQHSRGISTLLEKILQEPIINGLPEKLI